MSRNDERLRFEQAKREVLATLHDSNMALGRYDDGNDRSGMIAQVEAQHAIAQAVLLLADTVRATGAKLP